MGKGHGRVNIVQMLCIHVYNFKMILLKLFQEQGKDGIKENGGEVNSSMTYLIYFKDFCKCHNVPPPSTIIKNSEMGYQNF
jgi:hypothetical protein